MNLKTLKSLKADTKAMEKRKTLRENEGATVAANIASSVAPLGGTITRWGQIPKRGDRKKKGA